MPFAYTVGLFGMNHPELLILGVAMQRQEGCSTTSATRSGPAATFSPAN